MAKKRDVPFSRLQSMLIPVVTAQEMARLERMAVEGGCSEETFMAEAGRKVAQAALEWIEERGLPKRAALLVGKGNNGGDAFAAGICLLEAGIRVRALALYPSGACSILNRKFRERFRKKKGVIKSELFSFEEEGLILDGFLGTGFRGKVEGRMDEAIRKAIDSRRPILAIDIPSGLDGTSGEVRGAAILAQETIALGAPKSGFFLREGWNLVGKIRVEDFGLPNLKSGEAFANIPDLTQISSLLPPLLRNRHKYQAGYVVGYGGSALYRGAPKLTGLAALRAGAGIVRIFHKEEVGEGPYELILQKWEEKEWRRELKRARAVFMGPGIGQSKESLRFLQTELKRIDLPVVLDADALQEGIEYPKNAILTPHRGEVLRLLGLKKDTLEEDLLARCQKWTRRTGAILVLKGAPTYIFSPDLAPVIVPHGDPGMATAGAGDVLTGVLAALLAQGMNGLEAAVLGVALHALAGEEAALRKSSYGLISGDLIESLPSAFKRIGERGSRSRS